MKPRPIPITAIRLSRLFAWAQLWLVYVVGRCLLWQSLGRPVTRRELDYVARKMHLLLDLKVSALLGEAPRTRNRHGRLKAYTWRTVAGARFRCLTRGRTWATRVFAILAFVRDADQHIARQVKRLKRGLTRLRVLLPCAQSCTLPALAPCAVCAADTS